MKTFALLAVTALLPLAPSSALADDAGPVVNTAYGSVIGLSRSGAEAFEGIPYAAAPIGNLRWSPPQRPHGWATPLDARHPGSACPQPPPAGGIAGSIPGVEENCLFLNVWRPQASGRAPRPAMPVMVWFHGGGMRSSAGHVYEAARLVTRGKPIIVVTVNYRLNIMGFLALPGLSAEHPELASGNYGMLDQQFALKWVRDNIRAFGGDPGRVTIAGESGGAQSVCVQLASPTAAGLFHRAIVQSGACQWNFPSLSASESKGQAIAAKLGCAGGPGELVACMRRKPVAELLPMSQGMEPSGAPAVGGGVLPLNIREAISFDRFNHVPVMQGATADEALYYVVPFFDGAGKPVTAAQYPSLLRAFFGDSAGKVEEKYPLSAYRTPALAFSRAIGDSGAVYASRIGACNTLLGDRMLAAKVPLYAFEFADPDAPFPAPMFPFATGGITGPGHTSELTYLWDNDLALTSAQRRLSDIMIGYWSNFVASGDPNGPGLAPWPSFTPRRAAVQELANGSASSSLGYSADHNCAFWNELGYGNLYGWAGQRSPMPWEISQEQAHATDHAEPH